MEANLGNRNKKFFFLGCTVDLTHSRSVQILRNYSHSEHLGGIIARFWDKSCLNRVMCALKINENKEIINVILPGSNSILSDAMITVVMLTHLTLASQI